MTTIKWNKVKPIETFNITSETFVLPDTDRWVLVYKFGGEVVPAFLRNWKWHLWQDNINEYDVDDVFYWTEFIFPT